MTAILGAAKDLSPSKGAKPAGGAVPRGRPEDGARVCAAARVGLPAVSPGLWGCHGMLCAAPRAFPPLPLVETMPLLCFGTS